jgi:lipopolysaccharide export system protein LptA
MRSLRFFLHHTLHRSLKPSLVLSAIVSAIVSATVFAAMLSISLPAAAEKADRAKPMNAEADALRYDDVRQQSIFTGNVIITKGTMTIRADRVEVRQDREGYQFGTASSTGGKRAYFRQKREGSKDGGEEWIEGEAEVLSYDGKADAVTFTRNAVMRRLRGNTMVDETRGAVITYDNTTDVFSVAGGTTASGSPGRVTAVIGPRSDSPANPAASAPTPSTGSRTTQTIGGERR